MKTDENADFWKDRFKTIGHTGWKDPLIYAYDQLERLWVVRERLVHAKAIGPRALDFGCGTGDFSKLLLDIGYTVFAYDPYVTPVIRSPRFSYVDSLNDTRIPVGEIAIVLSITTLDHILDETELLQSLGIIRNTMCRGGVLLMIEYATTSDTNDKYKSRTRYQAYRELDRWKTLLLRSGLRVSSVEPMYHPLEAPSAGYLAYRRSAAVKCARYLLRSGGFARRIGERLLSRSAIRSIYRYEPELRMGASHRSPLKLIESVAI